MTIFVTKLRERQHKKFHAIKNVLGFVRGVDRLDVHGCIAPRISNGIKADVQFLNSIPL
jgi:hypothetical protein